MAHAQGKGQRGKTISKGPVVRRAMFRAGARAFCGGHAELRYMDLGATGRS